jgi:CRP/FNR family cyclic AMP-dependent transcriptional regulator
MEQTGRDIKTLLQESELFCGFSEDVLDTMIPLLVSCVFQKGNVVCLKGDESDCLYIIDTGEAEINVSSVEGKVITLGVLSPGDVVGEVGLLDGGPRTANVIAKTDAHMYKLSREEFEKLLASFGPKELKAVTSYICYLFRRATNSLEETAFMDADIRVARKILELYEDKQTDQRQDFELVISQVLLGQMSGLSREATNKALSHLEDEGLVKREYKKIVIPDVDALIEKSEY